MPDAADYVSKIDYRPRSREREDRGSTIAPSVPSRPEEYARLQPRPANYEQPHSQPQQHRSEPQPPPPTENTPSPLTRRQTGALLPTHVPSSLIPRFLALAQPNTTARIETLGLLLGREHLAYGRIPMLVVEVLLIPRQTGTSDTCAMVGEEQVLEVCLERGLDCLGWVCYEWLCTVLGRRLTWTITDTYASNAVVLHVLHGSAYTRIVPTDVARGDCNRLCALAK